MTSKFDIFLFYITILSGLGLLTNSILGFIYYFQNKILSNLILSIYILPIAGYSLCTQMDLTVMLNSNKRFARFYIVAGTLGLGLSFPSMIISLFIIINGLLYIFNDYKKYNIDDENQYVKQVNNNNSHLSPPSLSLSDELSKSYINKQDNTIKIEQINFFF